MYESTTDSNVFEIGDDTMAVSSRKRAVSAAFASSSFSSPSSRGKSKTIPQFLRLIEHLLGALVVDRGRLRAGVPSRGDPGLLRRA